MKPPRFRYHDPTELGEALDLLAEHDDDGKVLAGGQSLVPLLNFRLARPEHLIDLNRVGGLAGIRRHRGVLRIGAMTRQSALERSELVGEGWPLLTEAIGFVAHAQIRNRGTVGGSLAHSDPSAELPAAITALEASLHVRSVRGSRTIPAGEFFVTHLTTVLEPDELLTEIEVPAQPPGTGYAFTEFARRHGDFALGGAAVLLSVDASGVCERAAIALLAAAPTPVRAGAAERELVGHRLDEELVHAAAGSAVEEIEPTGDIHGSTGYRIRLIEAMVRRGIETAARRAGVER